MKHKNNLLFATLLSALLSAQLMGSNATILAYRQKPIAPGARNDLTPRGLFISKRADATRVQVMDAKTNALVSPSQKFTKDDKLKVVIESNFEGYVYAINVEKSDDGEKRFLLYPNPQVSSNRIKPNDNPPLELSVYFDATPATEIFQVIVSPDQIEFLDSVLKGTTCSKEENRCELDNQTAARVASIVGDKNTSPNAKRGGIFPKHSAPRQAESEIRSRDIKFGPGRDKDVKSIYMAIPVKGGGEARLKPKEVFAFEIRLKHI